MTTTESVWMTRRAHARLESELAALRSRPSIEVPDDLMDYDGNLATHLARQARMRQIRDLLINVGEDPPEDGFAEAGDFVAAPPECVCPCSAHHLPQALFNGYNCFI